MGIDGLSLSALVNELDNKLSGGRIDRIYQVDKYTLVMRIRQAKEDHNLIISAHAENPGLHITPAPPENPAVPPAFCMLLRKHFEEGRISRIYQHGLDRIVFLEIYVREERGTIATKSLIIEIMGKHSNIIFIGDRLIVDAIKRVGANINRFRQILPGVAYQYPPGQDRLDLLSAPTIEFLEALRSRQNTLLAKAIINTASGIGVLSSAEIVWRAGLPENIKLEEMDDADFAAVGEAVDSLKDVLRTGLIKPNILLDSNTGLKAVSAFEVEHLMSEYDKKVFDSMNEMMDFVSRHKIVKSTPERLTLAKLVESHLARLIHKREMLANDLDNAKNADAVRKYGDLLMANIYNIESHISEATLEDFYSDNLQTQEITIELDPKLTPIENAQAYYNRYAKLKRAQEILVVQLKQCNEEIEYLEGVMVAINNSSLSAEMNEIRQELITEGYVKENAKKRMKINEKSEPIKIVTPGGTVIIAGKNNRQNDFITFRLAGPDDLWLHTKDIPGSHVIMRIGKEDPLDSDLVIAAQLAAYFSKARQSSNVPVDYTRRRFVKKPAGAKPGFVIYTNQNTINATPNEDRIRGILV